MYDDTLTDSCRITVIATGLDDLTAKQPSVSAAKKAAEDKKKSAFNNAGFTMPTFTMPQNSNQSAQAPSSNPVVSNVPKKDIQIPDFLKNRK